MRDGYEKSSIAKSSLESCAYQDLINAFSLQLKSKFNSSLFHPLIHFIHPLIHPNSSKVDIFVTGNKFVGLAIMRFQFAIKTRIEVVDDIQL